MDLFEEAPTPIITETVKVERVSAAKSLVNYAKLVVPASMRSLYWTFFGFPANHQGAIISKNRIVCTLCQKQIAYNKNTTNLRGHLQNKHRNELLNAEKNNPPPKNKTKKSVKVKTEKFERVWHVNSMEEGEEFNHLEEEIDTPKSYVTQRSGAAAVNTEEKDMVSIVTNHLIMDLMPPVVVKGVGFQRLVVSIENPCSMPSKRMLVDDILPNLYAQAKELVLAQIANVTGLALTIEEWHSSRNVPYVSINVHFTDAEGKASCKMLETFPIDADWDEEMWSRIITFVFGEWRIMPESVTAVVFSACSQHLISNLERMGIPCIPCLQFTIQECVQEVFNDPLLRSIIAKVRKQVAMLKMNPTCSKLYQTALSEMGTPLVMDDEVIWISSLDMLSAALVWKNTIQSVLFDMPEMLLDEDDWSLLDEVLTLLKPLKMAAMTANEKRSYLSLVRPMLFQVIGNNFAESEEDSDLSKNLKTAIRGILQDKYDRDEAVALILDTATYIDPRFKCTQFSEERRKELGDSVYNEIKDIVVQCLDEYGDDEDCDNNVSNMQMLLGNFLVKEERGKMDMAATAMLEYQTYLAHPNIKLEHDPMEWWSKQSGKYPRLCHLSQKYLCLPSVTTLPGKSTLEQLSWFVKKRSILDADVVNKILFLHVNTS